MTKSIEIHINSDPSILKMMRAALSQICEVAGFSSSDANKIVLAVDEACTNIIRHAYNNKPNKPIIITCTIRPSKLDIVIIDHGSPVDVKKIKPRKLDELRPGGLGVYLMTTVMDKVKFFNGTDKGNKLIMSKNIPKEVKNRESGSQR